MTDNFFQNTFSNKPKTSDEKQANNPTEDLENPDDGRENVIQQLIYHSFYPSTCMVPLEENLIIINETVPDLMKAKEHDPLIQETIRTFHLLVQEKDDEILNLRRQLKISDGSLNLIEVHSEAIQTDLTLDECSQMEKQILLLANDLPEKNEKIHQLEQELEKIKGNKLTATDSKTADLEEAYKDLTELELKNSELSEQNKILQYKLEDVMELKYEIEDAKIQAENDKHNLEEILIIKDIEIEKCKQQLGSLIQSDVCVETKLGNQLEAIPKEFNDPKDNIDIVIEELKNKLFNSKLDSTILPLILATTSDDEQFRNLNDKEILSELIRICCDGKSSETDLKRILPIVKSISFQENGNPDIGKIETNIPQFQTACNILSKDQLMRDALNDAISLKMKMSLIFMEISDLKKEYMKLENILNILNKSFKLTQLGILNRMSKKELTDGVLEKRSTIFEISMHSFWGVISNNQFKENDACKSLKLTSSDISTICNTLFHNYKEESEFTLFISMLTNVRSILLYGELPKVKKEKSILYLEKLNCVNLVHDIVDHILPKYPREIRGRLLESTVETALSDLFKFNEIISQEFLISAFNFKRPFETTDQIGTLNLSWSIVNIFSMLNFEDDLFLVSTVIQKNEFPGHLLSLSNTTKKVEKVVIKFSLQKNKLEKLINTIVRIQAFLHNENPQSLTKSYNLKSENELIKIVIKKKEEFIKILFKDTFQPVLDKMIVPRGSKYFSCVSKDKTSFDFWMKMVLDRYNKDQIKDLQSFSEEDLRICLKRLLKCMELVSPNVLLSFKEKQPTKNDVIKLIFTLRLTLIQKLLGNLFGDPFKLKDISLEEMSNEINSEEEYESLIRYLNSSSLNSESPDLDEIVKTLYEIDCELFPGILIQDLMTKDLGKYKSYELSDEIVILRLAIASSMIYSTQSWDDLKEIVESNVDRWGVLKRIETTLINSELINIDNDMIDSERNFLKRIVNICRGSAIINDDKLRDAYIEVRKIVCRNNGENFDMNENLKTFNKISTKQGKVNILCDEVDSILKGYKRAFQNTEEAERSVENYKKLELLLEDMESNFIEKNTNFKETWIYLFYDKVSDIERLLKNDTKSINELKSENLRNVIMKYLEHIKQWVSDSRHLLADLFSRLNSSVRKLNNSSALKERKIKMSSVDLDLNSSNFDDEKRAFEKAFLELEERIKEIGNRSENKDIYSKLIETKIMDKNEEELKYLIVSLGNELSGNRSNEFELKEAKLWLNEKSKEQLEDECRALTHKVLMKKLDEFLNDKYANNSSHRDFKDDHMSQFEDDINLKLTRYQDLCDSVDKLKIPQTYSKGRNSPLIGQNEMMFSAPMIQEFKTNQNFEQPHSSRKTIEDGDSIDSYFYKRLNDIQNNIKSSNKTNSNLKDHLLHYKNNTEPNVLVDGFDIEDEKTSRFYSMKLQDIQHERKEDELATILIQMEQDRQEILEKNKNLQQQIFYCENIIETQQIKLEMMENIDPDGKQNAKELECDEKKDYDSKYRFEDMRLLKHEIKRLKATTIAAQHQLDKQNSNIITLSTMIDNLQHENSNLVIKNKYLQRSFKKLEEIFNDLVRQLESVKHNLPNNRNDIIHQSMKDPIKDSELERRLKQSERDKIDLVRKMDIIEQQNELLKVHCEKLDIELTNSNKNLAEFQSLSDKYRQQAGQLANILDKMTMENDKYQPAPFSPISKNKDEEIRRLKNKVQQLENRLIDANQETFSIELDSQNDQDITTLQHELGSLRDVLDDLKAKYEVKDYELRKLKLENQKLQKEVNEFNYLPSEGFSFVKDADC